MPEKALRRSLMLIYKVQQKLGMKTVRKLFWHNPIFRAAAILMSIYLLQNRGGEMIEVATLVGEQKEIILPDGSTDWMNSCSRISYLENFSDDKREVKLTGEAFFSVKSYPEDKITSTALISGKVEVKLEKKNYTLKPNQELVYNRTGKSSIIKEVRDNPLLIFNTTLAIIPKIISLLNSLPKIVQNTLWK